MMANIYDVMPPVRIAALIACRLRSIEIMCANALHDPARDFPNLGELPTAASDARFLGRDGVGAIGGGVLRAHGPNMTGAAQHENSPDGQANARPR